MKMSSLFVFSCVVLLARPASSQVELRYQWRPGDAFILDKVIDLAGTIRAGTEPPVEMSQRAKIRKKVTVERVDPSGRAELNIALLSVSATKSVGEVQVQYTLSPGQIVIDNTRIWQQSEKQVRVSPKVRHLRQLFMPRTRTCSPLGRTEDASQPVQPRQEASRSDLSFLLGVGEEGWLPLAEQPVSPGDSWRDRPARPIAAGTSELSYDVRLSLDRLETDSGGNVPHDPAPASASGPQTAKPWFVESHQQFTGSVDFDVDRGQVLRCKAEGAARMRYFLTGPGFFPDFDKLEIEYDWKRVRMRTEWKQVAVSSER